MSGEFAGLRELLDSFADGQFYPDKDTILQLPLSVVRERREFAGRAEEFLKKAEHLPGEAIVQVHNGQLSMLTDENGNLLAFK
jgi:hypothetical protein